MQQYNIMNWSYLNNNCFLGIWEIFLRFSRLTGPEIKIVSNALAEAEADTNSTTHSETKNEVHMVEGPASVAEATNQTQTYSGAASDASSEARTQHWCLRFGGFVVSQELGNWELFLVVVVVGIPGPERVSISSAFHHFCFAHLLRLLSADGWIRFVNSAGLGINFSSYGTGP